MVKKSKKQEIIEEYELLKKHYEPIWERTYNYLNTIKDPLEMIRYLKTEELEYQKKVKGNSQVAFASGAVSGQYVYPVKVGMDRLIEIQIEQIKHKYGLKDSLLISNPSDVSFQHNLNDSHFSTILTIVNKIHLFSKEISFEELKAIFNCNVSAFFTVNNNQHLAYLFNSLQPKFITRQWQSVIEKKELFKGNRNRFLTAKNLSKSLNLVNPQNSHIKLIRSQIEQMK